MIKHKITSNGYAIKDARLREAEILSGGNKWVKRFLYWCVLRRPPWKDEEFAFVYGLSASTMVRVRANVAKVLLKCG